MSARTIAIMLIAVQSVLGLQHSAMWSLNSAADGANWATLTFDVKK